MSSKLRNDIKNGERPKFDRRIYITLPKEKDHKEHVIGEVCYLSKSLIFLVFFCVSVCVCTCIWYNAL